MKKETKDKIRKALTGRKRPPFSDEWKRKISQTLKRKGIQPLKITEYEVEGILVREAV